MQEPDTTDHPQGITVYWRPGCGFCVRLLRQLDDRAVVHRLVNIWEEPDAAAFVRSVARGNETVPTVAIGDVALVNPSADEVMTVALTHAPDAIPAGWEPPEPSAATRLMQRLLGTDR